MNPICKTAIYGGSSIKMNCVITWIHNWIFGKMESILPDFGKILFRRNFPNPIFHQFWGHKIVSILAKWFIEPDPVFENISNISVEYVIDEKWMNTTNCNTRTGIPTFERHEKSFFVELYWTEPISEWIVSDGLNH